MKASERTKSMAERARERAERRKNAGGGLSTLSLAEGVELHKPEKGRESFDVLPYRVSVDTHPEVKKGDLWFERTYLAHRNVGPEEAFIICPRTIGKKCPICEEYNRLKKDPDADEDVVKGLRAKERQLFNIRLEGEDDVKLLDISTFLFGQLLEAEIREGNEDNAAFAELKGGKTLKVRWDQKKMGKQEFVEASRIDFIDREDLDEDEILEAVQDLDKILIIHTYEEIEKMMAGGADEEPEEDKEDKDDETEEDDVPAKKGKAKKKEEEPEDDDDDNEPEDDDDDDEPPAKKVKKSKKEEPEEDEDEPEDDDDDDDADDDDEPASDGEPCIACDGTGKTSKGKTCPVCEGSGKMEPSPADDDDDAVEETPKPKKGKVSKKEEPEDDDDDADDDEPEEDDEPPSKKPRRIVRR